MFTKEQQTEIRRITKMNREELLGSLEKREVARTLVQFHDGTARDLSEEAAYARECFRVVHKPLPTGVLRSMLLKFYLMP